MTDHLLDFSDAVDSLLGVAADGARGVGPASRQRVRLGEALVRAGVITATQLEQCLEVQRASVPRRRLGAVVVDLGLATDVDVAQGLAAILGFEHIQPHEMEVPAAVVHRVPRATAEALGIVPIGAGETWLRVAVADPTDRHTVEALREATGLLNISMAVATPRSIEAALTRFWAPGYTAAPAPVETAPAPAADEAPEADAPAAGTAWEYAFVGDGVPPSHPGFTGDLATTERELARLGGLGWEAVGVSHTGARMTVLLKRPRG